MSELKIVDAWAGANGKINEVVAKIAYYEMLLENHGDILPPGDKDLVRAKIIGMKEVLGILGGEV